MFHSSSIHNFDTMFVILCVIAGATSHDIPNSSKPTPIYKSHDRYKSSFIELLLEGTLTKIFKPIEQASNGIHYQSSLRQSYLADAQELMSDRKESTASCAQLAKIFNREQIRICQKHHAILVAIVPHVVDLAKKECARITSDLRWNCSRLDLFLDRSNFLSFTREAALIRSIINASMMYLTVKTCGDNQHNLCGCHHYADHSDSPAMPRARIGPYDTREEHYPDDTPTLNSQTNNVPLSDFEIKRLETGSPLRLTRSIIQRQACSLNIPFADALTRVFIDAEDTRSLNKAYKILNEESINNHSIHKIIGGKRFADTDIKDLSFIKWAKSAINLHNSHIGRQVVRDATKRHCRCHGISGMCQYQICWDRLGDFETVASRLRDIYLDHSTLVEPTNSGTYTDPDLYLARSHPELALHSEKVATPRNTSERIGPWELAYLYMSPDYCDMHPSGGYLGTAGRECSSTLFEEATTGSVETSANRPRSHRQPAHAGSRLGSCQYLCCNRGIYSELSLSFVECNCRFKFCCAVKCDRCLRQHLRQYCR